ncbi:MAG: DUF4878 domain-containing protein [Bacteroidia bacterium]|nr:DUF4878 domain-containing protein [Bacteroidia bacterium]
MRPFIFPVLSLIGAVIFSQYGCSGSDTSARGVAHKYLKARMEGNFAEAAKYVSPESQDLFEELQEMAIEYEAQDKIDYKIKNAEEGGRSASVFYDIEGYGEEQLNLIKADGEWKILLLPQSVPDASLLVLELKALEREDSSDIDKETLDQILINEGEETDWADSAEIQ